MITIHEACWNIQISNHVQTSLGDINEDRAYLKSRICEFINAGMFKEVANMNMTSAMQRLDADIYDALTRIHHARTEYKALAKRAQCVVVQTSHTVGEE